MATGKPKVLIAHPDPKDLGGVASFFRILEPFVNADVDHFINGRRPDEKNASFSLLRLLVDYLRFTYALITGGYDIIHLNPSLNRKGVLRDSVFLLISRLIFRKPTVIFFHGWEIDYAQHLKGWKLRLFCAVFGKATATIVLAQDFKHTLLAWGFDEHRIFVETTSFEQMLTTDLRIEEAIAQRRAGSFDVLFFARLIKTKGLYETLETFSLLSSKFPEMRLLIAGDGPEFNNVRSLIENTGLQRAVLVGYIHADQKKELLTRSSLLFLPSYTEGFPIAVVEAMAVGLPVVTRTVGGIKDFFVQRQHGFTTESKDPGVFAGFISELYDNRELYTSVSRNNHAYAHEHFAVPVVRRRLEAIYTAILPDRRREAAPGRDGMIS